MEVDKVLLGTLSAQTDSGVQELASDTAPSGQCSPSPPLDDIHAGHLQSPIAHLLVIRMRRSHSTAAYSCQTFPWTICWHRVCRSVGRSVCPVHCGKTVDRIRMPFGMIGRTDPGMRQIAGLWDRSMGRGTFGGEFRARHCNQWGLYGIRVLQRHNAALFPNYFGQTCYYK